MIFPLRPRRLIEPDLVVTWNGTISRADRPPTPPAPPRAHATRFDVLATLRGHADGLTMRAIADALDDDLQRINGLLYGLVQAGQVVAVATTERKTYGGQLRRYRAVSSPLHDVGRARGAHARGDVPLPTREHERSNTSRPSAAVARIPSRARRTERK